MVIIGNYMNIENLEINNPPPLPLIGWGFFNLEI
jgi:hypothetical protein